MWAAGGRTQTLILAAARQLDINDLTDVAIVGDAPSDMAAGTAAGAGLVIGVLTGSATCDELYDAGATDVIPSVLGVLDLVGMGVR